MREQIAAASLLAQTSILDFIKKNYGLGVHSVISTEYNSYKRTTNPGSTSVNENSISNLMRICTRVAGNEERISRKDRHNQGIHEIAKTSINEVNTNGNENYNGNRMNNLNGNYNNQPLRKPNGFPPNRCFNCNYAPADKSMKNFHVSYKQCPYYVDSSGNPLKPDLSQKPCWNCSGYHIGKCKKPRFNGQARSNSNWNGNRGNGQRFNGYGNRNNGFQRGNGTFQQNWRSNNTYRRGNSNNGNRGNGINSIGPKSNEFQTNDNSINGTSNPPVQNF